MPELRLKQILRMLSESGVDFIVVGGVAAALNGAPVDTYDVDVVYLRATENIERLLQSLDAEQRKIAVVNAKAYPDILTMADRQAALKGQPSGLPASKMSATQFELLQALVEEYARNMPDQIAQAREEAIRKAGKDLYFAWAGGMEKGEPHYYRVQSAEFFIEYDDTQNTANHIHSVWRDFNGDFGMDLLKQHYETSHHQP